MKKLISIIFILFLLISIIPVISSCNQNGGTKDGKINIVCTIFPQYDWVRQILGDYTQNINLTLLLDNRIDLHNYQPSVDDIIKISNCDLFIYAGGESDDWVDNALKEATNKNMIAINLLETLGNDAKEEEILEGMEDENENADESDNDEVEYDEHVWLSLKNAQVFCQVIAGELSLLKIDSGEDYKNNINDNLKAYIDKLKNLDNDYQSAINSLPVKILLFGDRFPFRYLVADYGLTPYAAFSGCSAETEASFETIIFLAQKVDELNLDTIMVTESSDKAIAKTIIENTASKNQKILVLDAIQSVTSDDVKTGMTYISIMENNLNVLKEALK